MAKRRFRINAGRYGGETTVGEINPDFVEFVQGLDSDEIVEIVMAWADSRKRSYILPHLSIKLRSFLTEKSRIGN